MPTAGILTIDVWDLAYTKRFALRRYNDAVAQQYQRGHVSPWRVDY